mmetsp:Transcript_12978/g.11486  ORF Transcript_12978/g.11486 Transcript_12978/m.11486 type:complete len:123 (+) Transcript_12978:384-752(+)
MARGVKHLYISCFMLKKKHLQSLVCHTRNLESLYLQECGIETLGVKFIDTNYKLQRIVLYGCGDEEYSDWVNNPEGFLSLLTAIEKCNLKYSLETIALQKSDLTDQDIIERCNNMGIKLSFR